MGSRICRKSLCGATILTVGEQGTTAYAKRKKHGRPEVEKSWERIGKDYAALLTTGRTKSIRSIVAAIP